MGLFNIIHGFINQINYTVDHKLDKFDISQIIKFKYEEMSKECDIFCGDSMLSEVLNTTK